jgi:hypothetical protein
MQVMASPVTGVPVNPTLNVSGGAEQPIGSTHGAAI